MAMLLKNSKGARSRKGSLLLEALITVGIAAMFLVALLTLAVRAEKTVDVTSDREEAVQAAIGGVEAVNTIAFADLSTGLQRLNFSGNQYSLSVGEETLSNGMTRTVFVDTVERDDDCEVVESGGTVDPDSYLVSSSVGWTDTSGLKHTETYSRHVTRWEDPQGTCFVPEESESILVDTSEAEWRAGDKHLHKVYVTNNGAQEVTIDQVMFTWDNGEEIEQIFIDRDKAWSYGGPGSPSGRQPSGTYIDVVDTVIQPYDTFDLHKVHFTDDMEDATLTLTLVFADGSTYETGPFEPGD